MRLLLTVMIVAAIGCGDAEREGLTADSAVIQNRDPITTPVDSARTSVDSIALIDSTKNSLGVALPTLVLIADSAEGDVLYRRKGKCLSCHGLDGKGLEGLGPNLQDSVWLHGDGSLPFIQRVIVEGIARPKVAPAVMPAFATTLTAEETYRIAAYVHTLARPGAAVADTTRVPTDTVRPEPGAIPPPPPPSAVPPPRSVTSPRP